jgi:hypothetical protein
MSGTENTRKVAIFVGLLFLTAMFASLFGGLGLIEPVLGAPDYLAAVSENETQVVTGVFLELINALAVVGIGILMFPIIKKHNETMAAGYLALRILESVACSLIVIAPLSLISISREYLAAGASKATMLEAAGILSIAERVSVSNLLIPVFLGLGALIFYSFLFQSKLLPRYIPVWGFIAALLILALNILLTYNVEVSDGLGISMALPMITNEIFLGFWLILKGFKSPASESKIT